MIAAMLTTMLKEEKQSMRALRAAKTLFFLVSMAVSFLVFSAPVLLLLADALLPAALLSASLSPHSSLSLSLLSSYRFPLSLVDIPLLSLARSALIILVYSLCDGPRLSRGPYLGITTFCSLASLVFLSVKASYFFNSTAAAASPAFSDSSTACKRAIEVALFVCSAALAVGHTVVAYRISCRERRKLLVYKIDIEAVSCCVKKWIPQ
uniref:MENTAL domain-containing protein n=1 Tax=Kalanchoe fedtschenkoi TaxID=63787 RepID=A0A7N0UCX7_KALFE